MRKFSYGRLLQWSECDPAGIIFFPHYAKWMVEGVNMMFLEFGVDPTSVTSEGHVRGLPSTGYSMQFHAPAFLHDELVHEITVSRLGRKSIEFKHRVLRNEQCLAEASETRVWTERGSEGMKSVELPANVREALEADAHVEHPRTQAPAESRISK